MLKAYALLRNYRVPLVADFHREYGIDLEARIADGSIRPSQVERLAANLSRDASLWQHVDPEAAAWGLQEHLLAEIADTLRVLVWGIAGGKGAAPKPIPRPGVAPDEETESLRPKQSFETMKDFDEWYTSVRASNGR